MFKLVVLACLVAAASASALFYGAPLAYSYPYSYSYAPGNYRGPLSLAPGQPANILASDGRPLDTLEVNADRAAHYTAKTLEPFHLLKKRSVAVAPLPLVRAPLTYPYAQTYSYPYANSYPYAYSYPYAAPLAYTAPLAHALL